MSATRVLCYSPYTKWALHGQWEMTMLHALRLRGADVRYVLCDGLFSDCDIHWQATAPRPANACELCQGQVRALVQELVTEHEWLGAHLRADERATALAWAAALPAAGLADATYGDWRVGEWVSSSVHSHLRRSHLDPADPEVERALRSYVSSGLIACFALDRLLDAARPDVLLLFNGRQSSTRVAYELADARGIRVVTHERGMLKETVRLTNGAPSTSLESLRSFWRDWADVPLAERELRRTEAYLRSRVTGRNLGWKHYNPAPQTRAELAARLGLSPDRPVWALFTSSDDETAAEKDYAGPFARQLDWAERTIAWAAEHPELDLVVRVHPNTAGRSSTGRNERQLDELRSLANGAPANVRFVLPDDDVSTYSLMDAAEVGLVYHSTVALELACRGKDVVVAGASFVGGMPFVRTLTDADGYGALLEDVRARPADPVEVRRLAYRFAYRYFLCSNIPFPLVRMPDPHTGVVGWTVVEELAPGLRPELDRIAGIVLDDDPVIAPPGPAERCRDAAAEDRWHAAASPRVSVVIPCHGYAHYLPAAVESVLAQTYDDYEIVIVDDGSPDDTAEVSQSLIAAHPGSRIELLRRPPSGQPAVPRNVGIAHGRGELIVCLDADDLLEPTFLEHTVAALDRHQQASIAFGARIDFDETGREAVDPGAPYHYPTLLHQNIIGAASLFRREAWEAAGGYPTDVPGYEDWAFWIACAARGHHAVHVPEAAYRYRLKAGGMWDHGIERDAAHKAHIVLAHPGVYTSLQRRWAQLVVAGDSVAASTGRRGVIPSFRDDPESPDLQVEPPAEQPTVRDASATTLALADELISAPELLAAWAADATPGETLVLLAPGVDADDCATRFLSAAESVTVDVEPLDVVLLTMPLSGAQVRRLALDADALLTTGAAPADLATLDRRLAA